MALHNQYKIKHLGKSAILYDASILNDPTVSLFIIAHDKNSVSLQPPKTGIGRAKVMYFAQGKNKLVLKHYYRGGLLALVVKDQYLGHNIETTRAFQEWRLLKKMQQLGLPVPEAVAAHVKKHLFYYRADLITREIEGAETLADMLIRQAIDDSVWRKVGSCIKSFHNHDVYHADLNARNILITGDLSGQSSIYLIDFDKSRFRTDNNSWKMANLTRLKCSLLKFKKTQSNFNFDEHNWQDLLAGYEV